MWIYKTAAFWLGFVWWLFCFVLFCWSFVLFCGGFFGLVRVFVCWLVFVVLLVFFNSQIFSTGISSLLVPLYFLPKRSSKGTFIWLLNALYFLSSLIMHTA